MAKLSAPFVAGFYKDVDQFKKACAASSARGHENHDAFTPYPIHGLEHKLGIKRSLLGRPILAILITGAFLGFMMQFWMMKVDWPIILAGKAYNSWPAYVVITFESGILLGAVSNFLLVLLVYCGLRPDPATRVLKKELTDDTFCLAVPLQDNGSEEELKKFLEENGAESVDLYGSTEIEPPLKKEEESDA